MVQQQSQTLHHQATMIQDLQHTMQAFMMQFSSTGKVTLPPIPQDQKRKDIPKSPPPSARRPTHGINNAGEDTNMTTPPDPHLDSHDVNISFESAQMLDADQQDDKELTHDLEAQETLRHINTHDTRSKSAMKKQC